MTQQRQVIARVLSDSDDHPNVDELHRRVRELDPQISIATVYRTLKLFEDLNVIVRHEFNDGHGRYEEVPEDHHDHLIDIKSGEVIEFQNDEIERLQEAIAKELGYQLTGHRLELYAVRLDDAGDS